MKLNNKGFGAVAPLIILAVLILVGFIGWTILSASNNSNNADQNTAQQSRQANYEAAERSDDSEAADATKLTTFTDDQNLFEFDYPESWVTLATNNDGKITLLSEERIEDETVTQVPLSKNIYLFFSEGAVDDPGAGRRYQAGENKGNFIEPLPEVFKNVTLANGDEAYIYKQLTSLTGTPAEVYFLADKDMNNVLLSNGNYLWFTAEFNGMQGDYAVVAPLKEDGTFNPDDRQEVKDFISAARSLEIK